MKNVNVSVSDFNVQILIIRNHINYVTVTHGLSTGTFTVYGTFLMTSYGRGTS